MRGAAANRDFEEAARFRDELKRLQAVELAIAADPLASQREVEAEAGAFAGERKHWRAANVPLSRPHKPTDAEMGPHNFGGEAKPRSSARTGGTRALKGRRH
jgi:excinuclease ABC subunit B